MARERIVINLASGEQTVVPYTLEEEAAADAAYEAEQEAIANAVPQPIISMYAAAYNLGVSNGEITGIETAARLAAALYLDVGLYMVFPTELQADTNYYPKVWDDAARLTVTEKGLDYFLVTSMDANGNPVDPSSFNIEIIRVSI
jgi:hypothetical protein